MLPTFLVTFSRCKWPLHINLLMIKIFFEVEIKSLIFLNLDFENNTLKYKNMIKKLKKIKFRTEIFWQMIEPKFRFEPKCRKMSKPKFRFWFKLNFRLKPKPKPKLPITTVYWSRMFSNMNVFMGIFGQNSQNKNLWLWDAFMKWLTDYS